MCANFEPITKNHLHLLNLSQPSFDYKDDIYPQYSSPILIKSNNRIVWRLSQFGLVARWVTNIKLPRNTYNARTETVDSKPTFKHAWRNNQLCLIPVQTIRDTVHKWLSLPVSIGLGRSKTEAKIATLLSKTHQHFNGVCDLINMDPCSKETLYETLDVGEVWGVGSKTSKKLRDMGVNTILDLACTDPIQMKKLFSITLARTIYELQGKSCIKIENIPNSKQQIIKACSFGTKTYEIEQLKEAISSYAQQACNRLRKENSLCNTIIVFIQSNPFDNNQPFYNKSVSYTFQTPTDYTPNLISAATKMIDHIFKSGVNYKKCGIILTALEPKSKFTTDLLTDYSLIEEQNSLMRTLDDVHKKFGRKSVGIGAINLPDRPWLMSRNNLTKNPFVWDQMPYI